MVGPADVEPVGHGIRELALQAQQEAGWQGWWPFVPVDLGNAAFREALARDPCLACDELARILASGMALGCIPSCAAADTMALRSTFVAEQDALGTGARHAGHSRLRAVGGDSPTKDIYRRVAASNDLSDQALDRRVPIGKAGALHSPAKRRVRRA